MAARKVILYIATSIDGYIAKPGDDLSFLNAVQQEGEDYGYGAFMQDVDTVILGRRTYDWVMSQVRVFPHADTETFVITRTARASIGKTHFYSGDLRALVTGLKNKNGKNIFLDGGAALVHAILQEKLIDEMIISVIPILLGSGIRLFGDGRPEQSLAVADIKQFPSGLVQLHYLINQ